MADRHDVSEAGRETKRKGEQIATQGKFAWLARLGYAARGLIYLIIGGLALMAAFGGGGGQTTGSKGALASLLDEPGGQALLTVLAIGLVGYALWRATQAIADTDNHGSDAKGVAIRVGLGVSAVTHLFLAAYAASIAYGWGFGGGSGGSGSGDSGAQSWSAWLLTQPGGPWILGLVGAAIAAAGLAQILRGWQRRYRKYLAMEWQKMKWADPVCRFGLIARGVVFVIIGGFVIAAAYQYDPQEVRGLGGTLRTVQSQSYGTILLAIMSLGLIAFGIYSFIEARYRRIEKPN